MSAAGLAQAWGARTKVIAVFEGEPHHGPVPAIVAIATKVLGLRVGSVSLQTTFDDLAFGALDVIEFTMWLEDAFYISITDEEMAALTGVSDAVRLVTAKLVEPRS